MNILDPQGPVPALVETRELQGGPGAGPSLTGVDREWPPCPRTAFAVETAREYARIKIDGLRLVGGNPDFTNAPGHGDDDARFYDRQQAYVHARGG